MGDAGEHQRLRAAGEGCGRHGRLVGLEGESDASLVAGAADESGETGRSLGGGILVALIVRDLGRAPPFTRSTLRKIFNFFTRRGSASSTSISNRPGPGTSSPRTGTRPMRLAM